MENDGKKKVKKREKTESGIEPSAEVKSSEEKSNKKVRTTKQKVVRAVIIILSIIILLIAIALITAYFVFKHYYNKTNYVDDKEVLATTMESSQLQSVAEDVRNDEIVKPIESSIYEDMSKTAEAEISDEEESSIYESIKESISDEEASSIHDDIYESVISSIVDDNIEANPDRSPEEIRESIEADKDAIAAVESKVSGEVEAALESKASSAYVEKESDIISSKEEEIKESISNAAAESAEEIASSMESEMESQSQAMENQEIVQDSNVYNVLLIGVDYNSYSDTIMLISINKAKKTIYMTSILRDTGVSIPGMGMMKINNSYRFGGAPLLVNTIENNLKIKIDNYAFVKFDAMWSIFDAAGGLDINISEKELSVANRYIKEMAKVYGFDKETYLLKSGGKQHMNGIQILAYCRVRYVGNGDVDRTNRQRTVISALVNKLKGKGIGELNEFLNTTLPLVTHNIPSGTVMDLLMGAGSYINYNLVGLRVPIDGTYSVNVGLDYIITCDLAANANYLKNTIY